MADKLTEAIDNVNKALREVQTEIRNSIRPENPYNIVTPKEFDELIGPKAKDVEAVHFKLNSIPRYVKEGIIVIEELAIPEWKFVVSGKSILIGPIDRS